MKQKDKSIFDFSDYKAYLRYLVGQFRQRNGLRSQLANAMNAQPAFISHVLNGDAHLSFEQLEATNRFFNHTEDEGDFLILLLHLARAGTAQLREHWKKKIQSVLDKREILVERLGKDHKLSSQDQSIYYSTWMYGAIHMATSIPTLNTAEKMAGHLRLPREKVVEILEQLARMGLVEVSDRSYRLSQDKVRIGRDSHNVIRHHANWRAQALRAVELDDKRNLHYSGCYSLSQKDFTKIKDNFLECLKSQLDIVDASPEEQLACLNIDFFSL